MHYRKSNKPKLLLMLVALLVLFATSIGFTYSWIEGGATYTIQTDDENQPVKTDKVPESVTYSGKITLDPTSGSTITLVKYDENTNQHQNLYFSPASSVDGENFLFPVSYTDGTTAFYREADINDVGTKYINFDFEIADTTKKCYVAFNGKPTITAKRGSTVVDASAFRVMIKCGEEKYIFTTADTNKTSTVATGTGGTTASLTAVPFTSYLNNANKSNKLFSYAKGAKGNIEVSVWLDEGSDTSLLEGCEITIDMSLIVVAENITANFRAVTYDKTGTKLSAGFTGGNIRRGSTIHTSNFSVTGTTFTATAEPKDGYNFIGWYSDSACTKLISNELVLPTQTPDTDVNYYAKFQQRNATTIYVEKRSGFSTYSVYAYSKPDGTTHHYTGSWPGTAAALDSKTGYYKLEFTTTDVGTFNVIISNNGAESGRYPAANVEGLEGTIGGTYLFTSDNTLIEFDPADMITVKAYGSSGGSGTVDGTSSVITRPGKTIALKATADSGYKFVGWYSDENFTTPITNSTTASQNITLTAADAGKTLTYHAKFEKIPTLTLKTSVTPTGGGSAYVNSNTSISAQIGSSVKLSASSASGYKFVGWYTNSACTTTTGITNPTSATSATYTVSGTANSTVTLYAKFEKSAKIIYFTPSSNWESEGNPRYSMYVFGTSGEAWASMTEIGTSNVFKAEMPEGTWEKVIFVRMNPATTENNWNSGVKWNQTGNLTLPTDSKNYFKFTSGTWEGGTTGTWSTYTE